MRIGNLSRPYMRELRNLNPGDTFVYEDVLWMKLDATGVSVDVSGYENQGCDPVLCVQVNNGAIVIFDQNAYPDQDEYNAHDEGFKVETFDGILVNYKALSEAVSFPDVFEQLTGEAVPW